MRTPSGSSAFAAHGAWLDQALDKVLRGQQIDQDVIQSGLDGRAASDVRRLLSQAFRRKTGTFFTTGPLRAEVSSLIRSLPGDRYLDPTCGAGDLLLAAAEHLPIRSSLLSTVRAWESRLAGWDIHPEFVDAARRRVLLYAASRHLAEGRSARFRGTDYNTFLKNISVGDALKNLGGAKRSPDVILLNPPFTRSPAPEDCSWATGKTSDAAVFLIRALDHVQKGGHVVAILPDALRSGSNFAKWRSVVENRSNVKLVKSAGLFDRHTDIDVFLLVAESMGHGTSSSPVEWWPSPLASRTIGEEFDIRVGTVVDNRDPHSGERFPFLVARDLPTSGMVGIPRRKRNFSGKTFMPPFVAIRRTSRPAASPAARVSGVIVTGANPIAVDNHLIVATPTTGDVEQCSLLLKLLTSSEITRALDERIRCRHLTVGVIRELPWPEA